MVRVVGLPVPEDGVQEDVDAAAGLGENGLVVIFVFGAFAPVVGVAGVVVSDG